jgi:hypothetical protein
VNSPFLFLVPKLQLGNTLVSKAPALRISSRSQAPAWERTCKQSSGFAYFFSFPELPAWERTCKQSSGFAYSVITAKKLDHRILTHPGFGFGQKLEDSFHARLYQGAGMLRAVNLLN